MRIMLKQIRDAQDLNQDVIAERLGVNTGQVSRWETGANNIPSGRLPEIAKAYGCRVSQIFADDEAMPASFSEEQLVAMVQEAMLELPAGAPLGDFPRVVGSNLHEQIAQYQAAGGFRDARDEASAPDTAVQPPVPTRRGERARSRTP